MEEIIRARIVELESECKKFEKKASSQSANNMKTIEYLIEIEKIKASINNLYICLGRK